MNEVVRKSIDERKRSAGGSSYSARAAVISSVIPITPQTELAAYMAKRMPKIGGTYLQAESEIAAINMVLGACIAPVCAP